MEKTEVIELIYNALYDAKKKDKEIVSVDLDGDANSNLVALTTKDGKKTQVWLISSASVRETTAADIEADKELERENREAEEERDMKRANCGH
jgi:hypothetical protein